MHHLKPSTRPHWHLDYIKNALDPVEIWTTTDGRKREHDWAGMLMRLKGASLPIIGFGATDCACRSHLIHLPQRPGFTVFKRRVQAAFVQHGPLFRLVRRFPPDEPKPGCALWAFDRIP
jgi:Uri superfamily endonuclease